MTDASRREAGRRDRCGPHPVTISHTARPRYVKHQRRPPTGRPFCFGVGGERCSSSRSACRRRERVDAGQLGGELLGLRVVLLPLGSIGACKLVAHSRSRSVRTAARRGSLGRCAKPRRRCGDRGVTPQWTEGRRFEPYVLTWVDERRAATPRRGAGASPRGPGCVHVPGFDEDWPPVFFDFDDGGRSRYFHFSGRAHRRID